MHSTSLGSTGVGTGSMHGGNARPRECNMRFQFQPPTENELDAAEHEEQPSPAIDAEARLKRVCSDPRDVFLA